MSMWAMDGASQTNLDGHCGDGGEGESCWMLLRLLEPEKLYPGAQPMRRPRRFHSHLHGFSS